MPLLRIGSVHSFSTSINPFYIPNLLTQTEKIIIKLAPSLEVSELLLNNKIDIAIINNDISKEPGITTTRLITEDFMLCLPKNSVPNHIHHISDCLKTLRTIPFVYPGATAFDYNIVYKLLQELNLSPEKTMEVDCFSTMCQMINRGECWGFMTPLAMWIGRGFIENITTINLELKNTSKQFYFCRRDLITKSYEKYFLTLLKRAILEEFIPILKKTHPNIEKHFHFNKNIII